MARPSQENTEIIVVNCDGRILVWCDGALSGDDEMRKAAEKATRRRDLIEISLGDYVYADHKATKHPEHVVASLFSYNPGRTIIQQISDKSREILRNGKVEHIHVQNS